jgi:carboxyl-terminal processing protease
MRTCHIVVASLLPILSAAKVADAQGSFSWFPAGSNPTAYAVSANGSPFSDEGATLSVRSINPTVGGYGVVTGMMDADTLAGRRVRISADIETKAVSNSASLWMRADSGRTMLVLDNGMDKGIKGTTSVPTHFDVTMSVPASTTRLFFGLLVNGGGEAIARKVRITLRPPVPADAPLGPDAQRELDSAFAIVRSASLWRDTVTWSAVEKDVRAMAAGSETALDTYPAIRALLRRLGDHHSFLMSPQIAAMRAAADDPLPLVRVQTTGVGLISVPAYSSFDPGRAQSYARAVYDLLTAAIANGAGSCRWIVDLRSNGGGNMWPMLGGLRPFLGEVELGSFVSSGGTRRPWHARDQVDVKPPAALAALESANVAVLLGPHTASSGEAVAISFIRRARTRSFGLPTSGQSTSNVDRKLPDGAHIALTVGIEADRTGKLYGHEITPDEVIDAAPSGAANDLQVDRALAWLRSQSCQ